MSAAKSARASAPLMIFIDTGVLNFRPRIFSTFALTSRTSASASAGVSRTFGLGVAGRGDGGGASAHAGGTIPSTTTASGASQGFTGRDSTRAWRST